MVIFEYVVYNLQRNSFVLILRYNIPTLLTNIESILVVVVVEFFPFHQNLNYLNGFTGI